MQARKLSSATGSPSTNAMFGIETPMGRTPLQLQGASLGVTSPRAKAPDFAKATSRLAFGVTYHNMRGAIASATAAWAILLDRFAVIDKCPNSRPALQLKRRPILGAPSPRRRRFDSPPSDPASRVTLVPVLKSLNTHERLPSSYSLNIGG